MTPTHVLAEHWEGLDKGDPFLLALTAMAKVRSLDSVSPVLIQMTIENGLAAGHSLFTIAQDVVELSDDF